MNTKARYRMPGGARRLTMTKEAAVARVIPSEAAEIEPKP